MSFDAKDILRLRVLYPALLALALIGLFFWVRHDDAIKDCGVAIESAKRDLDIYRGTEFYEPLMRHQQEARARAAICRARGLVETGRRIF